MSNDQNSTTDWNAVDPTLEPPFNTWPKWAVELDIEIADIAGDVGAANAEDTPEGKAKLAAYDAVRRIIESMVAADVRHDS